MTERKTEFLKFIRERFYSDKPISREDFEHLYRLAERGAKVPDGKFKRGDAVQRCNMPDGRPPAYRFPGFVCGEYDGGYVVSREGDLGCKQIFPAHMLELRTALGDKT